MRKGLRPGDWLILILSLSAVAASYPLFWQSGHSELAVIRSGGKVIAEFPLSAPRVFAVHGVLGETLIEIQPGRARIKSDPGPRQYCVQQGWLSRPGALALCAPNQVSLMLRGKGSNYDSLAY